MYTCALHVFSLLNVYVPNSALTPSNSSFQQPKRAYMYVVESSNRPRVKNRSEKSMFALLPGAYRVSHVAMVESFTIVLI